MNDSEFEDQLRALSPVTPSRHLAERIDRQLAAPRTATPAAGVIERPASKRNPVAWLWNLGWAGAGAVIALAATMILTLAPKPTSSSTASHSAPADDSMMAMATPSPITTPILNANSEEQAFEPTDSSRELIAVDDSSELIETAEGPVREVRYSYMERLAWAHPTTGARLEIEVPREDVYLIPVSLQ